MIDRAYMRAEIKACNNLRKKGYIPQGRKCIENFEFVYIATQGKIEQHRFKNYQEADMNIR